MAQGERIPLFVALFFALLTLVVANEPTSFCKCTCFTNSTIIELSMTEPTLDSRDVFSPLPREDDDDNDVDGTGYKPAGESIGGADFIITRLTQTEKRDSSHGGLMVRAPGAKPACNACTRRFCLEQGLQICENAREEDVMTACFQRDSNRDKAVVYVFIVATGTLLLWAAAKPLVGRWISAAQERRAYVPVASEDS